MSCQYAIDNGKDTINLTFSGTILIEDIETVLVTIADDPDFYPSIHSIVDIRAGRFPYSPSCLKQIAAQVKELFPDQSGKTAIVVTGHLETALAVLYQKLVPNGRGFQIFCTMDAALKWLESDCGQDNSPDNRISKGRGSLPFTVR